VEFLLSTFDFVIEPFHSYFAAYEVTKKALTPKGASPADLNLSAVILAGGTAGVAMWAIAIPPDVLKSRLQSAPEGTYKGFMDCARKTIAADGIGALWKGFGPAMGRVSGLIKFTTCIIGV
jgi:solute carrier family 25 carnitine/acylcarnitine transporter 20/29